MTNAMIRLFGDLSREDALRWRKRLEVEIASWKKSMGDDIEAWPDEISEEFGDIAQTWYWLGCHIEELDEEAGTAALEGSVS